jgi:hypothetical protein
MKMRIMIGTILEHTEKFCQFSRICGKTYAAIFCLSEMVANEKSTAAENSHIKMV